MDLNRETAMRLWNKSFGKETKAIDFAGRAIAKGAYNDRNSEFGWNVDHILPKSRGGVTADYNLICCHIKTNDEKGDKFPCFVANGRYFEIVKVQNHYEIREIKRSTNEKQNVPENNSDELDLFDSASGIRFFKRLKGIQNKKLFVGTVFIKLSGIKNTAVVDFIKKIFEDEDISFNLGSCYSYELVIVAHNYNVPMKDDMSELLDKCIVLNTYLSRYFKACSYIDGFDICYRVDYFENKKEMFEKLSKIDYSKLNYSSHRFYSQFDRYSQCKNSLFVNELVCINTEAGKKVKIPDLYEYAEYNYIFTNLAENLKKEANEK